MASLLRRSCRSLAVNHCTLSSLHCCRTFSSSILRISCNARLLRTERFRQSAATESANPMSDAPCCNSQEVEQKFPQTIRDRKPAHKAATGPTTVAQSAAAAVAGALPDVLSATFPETFPTLSAARRVIRKDLVLVDGTVGTCNTAVAAGQVLQQLEAVAKHKAPRTVSLEIAYEDDSLAVVHKPWGVKMYGGDARRTITGALRAGALQPTAKPDALPEPKAVHRLDAAVGGLIVVAKTASALAALSAEFERRKVHKVYHALLCGRLNMEAAAGSLQQWQWQQQRRHQEAVQSTSNSTTDEADSDIDQENDTLQQQQQQHDEQQQQQQSLDDLLQLQLRGQAPFTTTAVELADPCLEPPAPATAATAAAVDDPNVAGANPSSSSCVTTISHGVYVIDLPLEGKSCYTLVQILGFSQCPRFGGWMTTVALSPVTGRKHQLRQHTAALGHPIVGDGKYALNKEDHISNQGIYLESLEVWFTHPETQEFLHVKIPEPQRFATLRQQQHSRWTKLQAKEAASAEAESSSSNITEGC